MLATRKGARREAGSEGSVVQNRDSTYRNRMRGRSERASVRVIAKPISIKAPLCISDECAVKVVELTPGDLRCCPCLGLWESKGEHIAAQKSAEGVIAVENPAVDRERSIRCRKIRAVKARTVPGSIRVNGSGK